MCAYPYGMAKHPHSGGYFGVSNLEAFLTIWPSLTMSSQELMDWAAGHNFFSFVLRSDQPGMESSIIYSGMRKCVHLHLLTIGYAPPSVEMYLTLVHLEFLALSSKPFYSSLENGSHPLYHHADPFSDHKHLRTTWSWWFGIWHPWTAPSRFRACHVDIGQASRATLGPPYQASVTQYLRIGQNL